MGAGCFVKAVVGPGVGLLEAAGAMAGFVVGFVVGAQLGVVVARSPGESVGGDVAVEEELVTVLFSYSAKNLSQTVLGADVRETVVGPGAGEGPAGGILVGEIVIGAPLEPVFGRRVDVGEKVGLLVGL